MLSYTHTLSAAAQRAAQKVSPRAALAWTAHALTHPGTVEVHACTASAPPVERRHSADRRAAERSTDDRRRENASHAIAKASSADYLLALAEAERRPQTHLCTNGRGQVVWSR